jgi:hypothetical protein
MLMVGAPALVAASFAVALVAGLRTAAVPGPSGKDSTEQAVPAPETAPGVPERRIHPTEAPQTLRARLRAPLPFSNGRRAQDVSADLRLLVDDTNDLSGTTQRALRITRRLGGYVLAVQYGTSEPREGTATLRLRIPVSRVQAAVVRFSDLGRILAQQTRISDLQQPLDELTRRIRTLERRAARAHGKERERILAEIAYLRGERGDINRRAAFATVAVDLTTQEPEKKATPPGRLDRAVDDASGVLTAELAIAAYALIVASPFLVLLAAAYAGSRAYRRHADQRLLERA